MWDYKFVKGAPPSDFSHSKDEITVPECVTLSRCSEALFQYVEELRIEDFAAFKTLFHCQCLLKTELKGETTELQLALNQS